MFLTLWADRLDCSRVEWLDKEVVPEPPQGRRHVFDLVAKLPTRQAVTGPYSAEQWLALVHIEQGDNGLGVTLAALMKIAEDRVAWLGAEALRRISEATLSD